MLDKSKVMHIKTTSNVEACTSSALKVMVGDVELAHVTSVNIGNDDGELLPGEMVMVTIKCACVLG